MCGNVWCGAHSSRYAAIGLLGVLSFREDTKGDILKNYSARGGVVAHFIEAVFCFSICMTYPLVVYPLRDSLGNIFQRIWPRCQSVRHASPTSSRCPMHNCCADPVWHCMTIGIIVCAFGVAILIPSVEAVFGLTGSTMGFAISFMIPSAMYLKATGSPQQSCRRQGDEAGTKYGRQEDDRDSGLKESTARTTNASANQATRAATTAPAPTVTSHRSFLMDQSVARLTALSVLVFSMPMSIAALVQTILEMNEGGGEGGRCGEA